MKINERVEKMTGARELRPGRHFFVGSELIFRAGAGSDKRAGGYFPPKTLSAALSRFSRPTIFSSTFARADFA